ncbi:MAG: adenylate/guanylate cyclase domain-containing protein [Hyphomicrobiales bacterium]|nr:adenylate/guanylate cyclase domain-containing protein [Hyphomicrobiales bacterium]
MSKILGRRVPRTRLERRLAAIVAADVVGYSRLMGLDEEETVRRLRALQACVSRIVTSHDGRIFTTAGDAMVFEFSSSTAALECTLAIQRAVHSRNHGASDNNKMLLRIGVNVGEVIVDADDIFGEVVNIAARLEAMAEPGGVCISHVCYMQTKRKFAVDFADLGERRLKNILEPVRVYAVRPPCATRPAGGIMPVSEAPAALSFAGAPPSAAQDTVAAHPAPDTMSRDACAAGTVIESSRHGETAKVLPWPGRRRA